MGCSHECGGQALLACHVRYGFRGQRFGEASHPEPPRRRSQFETQLDSDNDAPLITASRFGPLSSEDKTLSVRVSPLQVVLGRQFEMQSRPFPPEI